MTLAGLAVIEEAKKNVRGLRSTMSRTWSSPAT
jgi:hypothetical protein